jgi:Na+-transporting NADH:ubiquinone oxidoreductase subunit NqrF
MPANAKLLHSQPSRQIWLGGRNARGMYAEDIDKIQKNLGFFRYDLKNR